MHENYACYPPRMSIRGLTPILNVSDLTASFVWFEKWGWKKLWDWGVPATFGALGSGECEIFLCYGAQGGRGRGTNSTTFQQHGDEVATGVFGCRFGWTMLTRCIGSAPPPV